MRDETKLVTRKNDQILNKETLRQQGINIDHHGNLSRCKENEIFLMDKDKMFLVSSEKIVHDISGSNCLIIHFFLFLTNSSTRPSLLF